MENNNAQAQLNRICGFIFEAITQHPNMKVNKLFTCHWVEGKGFEININDKTAKKMIKHKDDLMNADSNIEENRKNLEQYLANVDKIKIKTKK
jgi:hypothetical protein